MSSKIKILTIGSLLAFLLLSGIQYYLIKNTYNYKVINFERDLVDRTRKITKQLSTIDSIENIVQEKFQATALQYYNSQITRTAIIDSLYSLRKNGEINDLVKNEVQTKLNEKDLDFGLIIESYILFDSITNDPDTIIHEEKSINHLILGEIESFEDAILVNTNVTSNNLSLGHNGILVKTKEYISINKWKTKVFRQMWFLIGLSIFILLSVISMFIYTLRSWMKQKQLSDIKTDFINNISHEFKTPLASLSLASKTLKNPIIKSNEEIFNSTLDSIDRQNLRLQKLMDQVLNRSMGLSEIELSKEPISDKDYLENVIKDFQYSIKENQLQVSRNITHYGLIRVDKFYLTAALFNLLENAVKYGGEELRINVKSERFNDDLVIKIQDNGIGISKNELSSIFEKFYRVNTGDVHNVKGLGLGLFYTKNIITAHEGTIEVQSKISEGSTFIIRLKNAYL